MAGSLLIILSVFLYFSVAVGSQSLELRLLTLERKFEEQQGVIAELGKRLTETENKNFVLEERLSKSEFEKSELKRKISKLENLFVGDSLTTNTNNRLLGFKHGRSQEDGDKFLNNSVTDNETDSAMPGDMTGVLTRSNGSKLAEFSDIKYMPVEKRTSVSNQILRNGRSEGGGIAFHASLSNNHCFQAREVIVFDHEEIDIGAGYNEHDGIYNIPSDGVYAFTMTVVSQERGWVRVQMLLNGVVKATAVSDAEEVNDFHSSSAFTIVQAHTGDHVFMRMDQNKNCDVVSDGIHGKTTFSGWKLF